MVTPRASQTTRWTCLVMIACLTLHWGHRWAKIRIVHVTSIAGQPWQAECGHNSTVGTVLVVEKLCLQHFHCFCCEWLRPKLPAVCIAKDALCGPRDCCRVAPLVATGEPTSEQPACAGERSSAACAHQARQCASPCCARVRCFQRSWVCLLPYHRHDCTRTDHGACKP
jgi:hypothetical protein